MKCVPINTSTDTGIAFHMNKDVHAHHTTYSWFFADLFLVSLTDPSVSALLSWTHSDNEIMFFSIFFSDFYTFFIFCSFFVSIRNKLELVVQQSSWACFSTFFLVQSFRLSHRLRMRRYFFCVCNSKWTTKKARMETCWYMCVSLHCNKITTKIATSDIVRCKAQSTHCLQ